jgi:hypothetical protein
MALSLLTFKKSEPALLFSPLDEGQKKYPAQLPNGAAI